MKVFADLYLTSISTQFTMVFVPLQERMNMETVLTPSAPVPAGHYSQALIHGELVFVSGQLPVDPGTSGKPAGSVEEQAEQALKNLAAILRAAGSDLGQVLKTTVYVSDIRIWERVNAVYARVFGSHRPARTVVPAGVLHHGFQVEIDAIAVRSTGSGAKIKPI